MQQTLLIGLGAGAASAMLALSVVSGSPLSLLLVQLAPLPILIAALGWTHWTGLAAALIAAVLVGTVLGAARFVDSFLGTGLPAWWLGYLALLARPAAANGAGELEWYPVGRLLMWSALIATAMVIFWTVSNFGADREAMQAGLRREFERLVRAQPQGGTDPLLRPEAQAMVDYLVGTVPLAAAAVASTMHAFNLWLAGRVVRASGRLKRPWPDLPALTLPPLAVVALAAAVAGSFLPDLPGFICSVLAASLFTLYAMLGFAVLHMVTRGTAGRGFILAIAYGVVVPFSFFKWPLLAMSMLGLAETAFGIRARFASKRGPPGLPT